MAEENVHQVPRGLTLDQAQFLGLQQKQDELSARLNQLTQLVEQLSVARAPPPRAHRVPRRNVQVEDEADQEDELLEEEALPVPRQEQRGVGNNLNLKIPQFKGTSSPEDYLEWVQCVDKVSEYYEYSKAQKCQPVILEFTDYANLWWENIKAQRRRGSASRWNEPQKEVEGLLKFQAESAKVKEQEVDPQPPVQRRDIKCLEFHGFRHFTSEFPNWRDVTIQNPHAIESEVEEAVEDVCGVTSKEKVEYADEGEKLKVQQVVSSESKLEEQRECLESISK
ncbi:hypothetical protein CRG98_050131, partial [Punica granatum]